MNKKLFLEAMGLNDYGNRINENKIKELIKKSIDSNLDNNERGYRNLRGGKSNGRNH